MPVLDEDAAQLLDYLPSALNSVVTWTVMPSAVLLMSTLAQPWGEGGVNTFAHNLIPFAAHSHRESHPKIFFF